MHQVLLPRSYRVFEQALGFLNELILMRRLLLGGKQDIHEVSALPFAPGIHSVLGSLHWLETLPPSLEDDIRTAAKTVHFVIITLDDYVEEAKKRFNTELVYTPTTFKGGQKRFVLLWKLFGPELGEASKRLQELLAQPSCSSSGYEHRPKDSDAVYHSFGPLFNQLIVGCSRASNGMIIYQPHSHALAYMLERLKAHTSRDQNCIIPPDFEASSTPDEWLAEALVQFRHGNITVADGILAKLRFSKQQADEWKEMHALSPVSASSSATIPEPLSASSCMAASSSASQSFFRSEARAIKARPSKRRASSSPKESHIPFKKASTIPKYVPAIPQ
ncbi:MAG: hypothetical protein OJI67_10865, partial [Prosthecobacter sp.]|nr:hypothetical protein [Prosthecobacter sp.]